MVTSLSGVVLTRNWERGEEQARESSSLEADFGDCALVKVQWLPIGCYSNLFLHRQNTNTKLHAP